DGHGAGVGEHTVDRPLHGDLRGHAHEHALHHSTLPPGCSAATTTKVPVSSSLQAHCHSPSWSKASSVPRRSKRSLSIPSSGRLTRRYSVSTLGNMRTTSPTR